MPEVCYIPELSIRYSLSVELSSSGSLLDLLDTISPFAKHTPFFHHDRSNSDHAYACLIDHELLYFLHADPCR
jgi:hypothetical protein